MIEAHYQKFVSIFAKKFPKIFSLVFPCRKILKYLIAGGLATLTTLFSLYLFTEFLGVWYVISSIIASALGIAVSFFFQKFWTFRDQDLSRIKSQAFFYTVVMSINVAVNASGIFLLVHYLGLYYLLAQIIISAVIAITSFFIYGKLIFKKV